MKRKLFTILLIVASLVMSRAYADECGALAEPIKFNKVSAMRALFCYYNEKEGGTLVPANKTINWNMKSAKELITPVLTATYDEAGLSKGVIVVQRQTILNGEIEMAHAVAAITSVYVFQKEGSKWKFEKGRKNAANYGAHGSAPNGKLVRIGKDKYGVLFEGGDVHQGYTNDYAFIITLSEKRPYIIADFETGNGYNDWSYEGKINFVEDEDSDYFAIRVVYTGTKRDYEGAPLQTINRVDYYSIPGPIFTKNEDGKLVHAKLVDSDLVYKAGKAEEREQDMPTLPRKLLRR